MYAMYTMTLNMYKTENVSATTLDANIIVVASDGNKNQMGQCQKFLND